MSETILDKTVTHDTFVIECRFPVPPARVFAAFADPDKKKRWFAEGESHQVESFETDLRVGGVERTRYRFAEGTPFPGVTMSTETRFHDVVPDERVVAGSTMSLGDRRISASLETFEFLPSGEGTELVFTHQGAFFEGSDGPDIRRQGWRSLLARLATELES